VKFGNEAAALLYHDYRLVAFAGVSVRSLSERVEGATPDLYSSKHTRT
jgi:hypothetical protein